MKALKELKKYIQNSHYRQCKFKTNKCWRKMRLKEMKLRILSFLIILIILGFLKPAEKSFIYAK